MEITLGQRARFATDVLLVEGLTRAGKFFLGNLLSGFESVEQFQYHGLLEHLPFLVGTGLMPAETAHAIIQTQVDNWSFDLAVGRGLNFRYEDKSSVYHSPRLAEYLGRCTENRERIVERINSQRTIFPFIVHEQLSNIEVYFDCLVGVKVISLKRSPVDLAHSWYRRGWGRRWGIDPLDFSIPLQSNGAAIPWFAHSWHELYERSSEVDRVILSIDWLTRTGIETTDRLPADRKERIHSLAYENLITDTHRELERIREFLGTVPGRQMRTVLAKEGVPNAQYRFELEKKREELFRLAGDDCRAKLEVLEQAYRSAWGI